MRCCLCSSLLLPSAPVSAAAFCACFCSAALRCFVVSLCAAVFSRLCCLLSSLLLPSAPLLCKGGAAEDHSTPAMTGTQQLLCSCHSRSAMIFSRSSLAEERRRRQQQRRKKTAETREDCSAERHDKAAQSSGAETGAEGSSRNRRRRQQQRRAKTAAQTSAAEIASTKLEQSTHRKGTVSGICDSMACSIEASSSSFSNSIPKPLFFGGDVI